MPASSRRLLRCLCQKRATLLGRTHLDGLPVLRLTTMQHLDMGVAFRRSKVMGGGVGGVQQQSQVDLCQSLDSGSYIHTTIKKAAKGRPRHQDEAMITQTLDIQVKDTTDTPQIG